MFALHAIFAFFLPSFKFLSCIYDVYHCMFFKLVSIAHSLCVFLKQYINLKALEIWKHSFCKKNSHAFISWRIWDKYDVRELTVGLSTHRLYRKSKIRFSVYRPGGIQVIHIILKIRIRKKEGKKERQHLTFHLYISMKWWYIQQALKGMVVGAERIAQ